MATKTKPASRPTTRKPSPAKKTAQKKAANPGKRTAGQPTLYRRDLHPQLAEAWANAGKTDDEIAEKLGVARSTINLWKIKHPEFSDALNRGKTDPDDRVERSLYERAIGYSFASEKIVTISDGQGCGSHVERVAITEHCPPDVTACIFWLKNRRKDRWRDRFEVGGPNGGPIELAMTPDQRDQRIAELLDEFLGKRRR